MSHENFISIRQRSDEMFEVVVQRTNAKALTLEAANAAHASRIAGSLADLMRSQDPESELILETHAPERERFVLQDY